jgi:TRAP-type C4-dicarboxylate transport system permease small subunit
MTYLEKFESFNRRVSAWFERVGVCGLLLMMAITCADVVGAKLFLQPVYGALDLVMFAQLVAISFATAFALILGRHVAVEFFVILLPARLQAIIDSVISFLGLTLFALIVWRLAVYGYSLQVGGEVSATLRMPLYPFAYSVALASIPVSLVLLVDMLKAIVRIFGR